MEKGRQNGRILMSLVLAGLVYINVTNDLKCGYKGKDGKCYLGFNDEQISKFKWADDIAKKGANNWRINNQMDGMDYAKEGIKK